jgi:hypothetical protein
VVRPVVLVALAVTPVAPSKPVSVPSSVPPTVIVDSEVSVILLVVFGRCGGGGDDDQLRSAEVPVAARAPMSVPLMVCCQSHTTAC